MESYVEVAFLHNWMSTLLSVWMALFVIQRPLRGRRVLLYSALASLYSSLAFFDHIIRIIAHKLFDDLLSDRLYS